MQELNMMYSWCQKLKDVFQSITQMYEDYARKKGVLPPSLNPNNRKKQTKKDPSANTLLQTVNNPEFQKQLLREESAQSAARKPAPSEADQKGYSYKQRIAAFRKLNKKIEQELDDRQAQQEFQDRDIANKKKLSSFFVFMKEKRDSIISEHPEFSQRQITKILGQVWKSMGAEDRKAYEVQNREVKNEFDKKFRKYLEAIVKIQKSKSREKDDIQDSDQ